MPSRLANKWVLITGASSGMGQALARRYAQAGWRLALLARRDELLQQWIDEQGWGPQMAQAYGADVSQPDQVAQAAQRCVSQQGWPDVVVANAGISVGMDMADARAGRDRGSGGQGRRHGFVSFL